MKIIPNKTPTENAQGVDNVETKVEEKFQSISMTTEVASDKEETAMTGQHTVVETEPEIVQVESTTIYAKPQAETSSEEVHHHDSYNSRVFPLPSQYMFYPVDEIYTRNFKLREYTLLSVAQSNNDFSSLAEAISRTVKNFDGKLLTYGDFQYIMYMHRHNMKVKFYTEFVCEGEEHNKWVEEGKGPNPKAPDEEIPFTAESLEQKVQVKKTDYEYLYPDVDTLEQLVDAEGNLFPGLRAYPTTLRDSIAFETEKDDIINNNIDKEMNFNQINNQVAELTFMNDYASILDISHGTTLEERRKFFEDFCEKSDLDTFEIIEKLEKFRVASDHGVKETVSGKCGVCGHEQRVEVRFSPTDFFPNVSPRGFA